MSDLLRRIARLETLCPPVSPSVAATDACHQRRMAGLAAFVRVAFPENNECIAHHVARILGMPDSPAMRTYLKGQPLEAIARDRYGETWKTDMEATAAEAAMHCEAAHGQGWWGKFALIWLGE